MRMMSFSQSSIAGVEEGRSKAGALGPLSTIIDGLPARINYPDWDLDPRRMRASSTQSPIAHFESIG
jgi:hypothetical protein